MSLDKVSDNRVVTGSDGGRSAANLNYILYLIGLFTVITALIGVVLAYSNRETASETMRSHFDWQIKIFWRSFKFWIVTTILYVVFTVVAVATLGVGFILYLIPFAIVVWWWVSTLMRIVRGMKALGLGQPVAFAAGAHAVPLVAPAVAASPAPVTSMPPEGWYDDAERPGHTRWWDGTAWGLRDDEHPSQASLAPVAIAASAETTWAAPEVPELDSEAPAEVEVVAASAGSPTQVEVEPVVVAASAQPAVEGLTAPTASSPPEPVADEPPQPRFCESCGAERRAGARFCSSCGYAHQ